MRELSAKLTEGESPTSIRRTNPTTLLATIMGHEDYSTTVEHYFSTTEDDISRLCQAANGLERPPD